MNIREYPSLSLQCADSNYYSYNSYIYRYHHHQLYYRHLIVIYVVTFLIILIVLITIITTIVGEGVFAGTALTSVSIPSSVTTIGAYAFQDCNLLTTVSIASGASTIGKLIVYNKYSINKYNVDYFIN